MGNNLQEAIMTIRFVRLFPVLLISAVWAMGEARAADIIDIRARAMKEMDRALRDIAAGLSGAMPFDAADALAKAEMIRREVAAIPSRFPEGSLGDTSEALPAIWEKKGQFADVSKDALRHADALLAAARAKDQERMLKSLRQLNRACADCHSTFRRR
jgi:cytochrome c556